MNSVPHREQARRREAGISNLFVINPTESSSGVFMSGSCRTAVYSQANIRAATILGKSDGPRFANRACRAQSLRTWRARRRVGRSGQCGLRSARFCQGRTEPPQRRRCWRCRDCSRPRLWPKPCSPIKRRSRPRARQPRNRAIHRPKPRRPRCCEKSPGRSHRKKPAPPLRCKPQTRWRHNPVRRSRKPNKQPSRSTYPFVIPSISAISSALHGPVDRLDVLLDLLDAGGAGDDA